MKTPFCFTDGDEILFRSSADFALGRKIYFSCIPGFPDRGENIYKGTIRKEWVTVTEIIEKKEFIKSEFISDEEKIDKIITVLKCAKNCCPDIKVEAEKSVSDWGWVGILVYNGAKVFLDTKEWKHRVDAANYMYDLVSRAKEKMDKDKEENKTIKYEMTPEEEKHSLLYTIDKLKEDYSLVKKGGDIFDFILKYHEQAHSLLAEQKRMKEEIESLKRQLENRKETKNAIFEMNGKWEKNFDEPKGEKEAGK